MIMKLTQKEVVEHIMLAIERVSNAPNYQSVPYLNFFGKS